MEALLILLIALAIDLTLGEPPALIHPVVWMGKLTSLLEKGDTRQAPMVQFAYGAGITLFVAGIFTAGAHFILSYLENLQPVAFVIFGAALLKSTFSLKELRRAALKVRSFLVSEKLDEARYELRALVSRDTRGLSKPLLVSASVESVAESACDSFVAPLFYFLLFGVPGAIAYRAVNTLDATIGYHGRYEYLGKFAARLDDMLNYIPARLTALLLVSASFLSGKKAKLAWQVALNEHSHTESPNAGWPMAAIAGALDVQLEKVGHYKLGRSGLSPVPETIDASVRLVSLAALIWAAIIFAIGGTYLALRA